MEDARAHVYEAGGPEHVGEVERCVEVYVERGEACYDVVPEFADGVNGRHAVVVGLWAVVDFLQLDPAARFEMAAVC